MESAWAAVSNRYEGYRLVLPGELSFLCQPDLCEAHCFRAFHVALGEEEVERLAVVEPVSRFLEHEDGEPVNLPLARPFVLARQGGQCIFLSEELSCQGYQARPDACRLYPHQVVFVQAEVGRPSRPPINEALRALNALISGEYPGPLVPLLLRHVECPGFTGRPMTADEWAEVLSDTYALQSRL